LSLYEEQFTDFIAQGTGEDLMDMYPEELRVAIDKYLDKGPDFIKYGGTSHWSSPTFIGFSPDAQKIIVDETHKRGLSAETHATSPEGLKMAIDAGIDLIQHPEVLDDREMSDAMIAKIHDRNIVGSMLVSSMTGPAWKKHLDDKESAQKKIDKRNFEMADPGLKRAVPRSLTSAEKRRDADALGFGLDMRRLNAQKLIKAGCILTVGTDNYAGAAPEYARGLKPVWQEPGIGTLIGIEGLVELGMSTSQAIVSGTKNGAIASKSLSEFGTVSPGKIADLLILDADPLADIHNIEKLEVIFRNGKQIDPATLPTDPVMFRKK
jgi:imidazolonepropionase-like amidohydrolase